MATIKSETSITLSLPPSCIEFAPSFPNYAAIGTYFLDKDANSEQGQKRSGSIELLEVGYDTLTVVQVVETEYGILDLHFSPHEPDIICTANSTASITFFRIGQESGAKHPEIVQLGLITGDDFLADGVLALSLQWHPANPNAIAITSSVGDVLLLTIDLAALETKKSMEGSSLAMDGLVSCTSIAKHELEAWTSSFTPLSTGIYSGGDDCVLGYVPLAEVTGDASQEDPSRLQSGNPRQDRRIHDAGVTAILPLSEHVLLTGSYDDHIRIIDTKPNRPKVMAGENLGGGVWRLKLIKSVTESWVVSDEPGEIMVLASCMYTGARIVRAVRDESGNWKFEVVARFEEHESMNYGSDLVPGCGGDGEIAVVSTSFYDKLVCLWRYRLDH
ncbi:hypothetical protein BT63DRAFT_443782 [Microthyrium microscopicum]|uniref:methylated diphthine methylhydrolase n=1 Tax=Microthyrium microscopicum TaxID=703497 RepID=A0A6A6TXD9_9PEZI|nr:hypothetical protein BT63DRAFT_443782 [Microthyrium microscopicum]